MSDEHVNGNGVDTGTQGEGSTATQQNPPDWAGFMAGFDKLNDTIRDQVAAKLDTLTGTVQQATTAPAPTQELPPPNYEEMTNTELASHMMGSIQSMIENTIREALAPLDEQFSGLQRTVASNAVTLEMKDLQTTHKDFRDWKDEMIGLATQHPSLGLADVYKLARANNPAKAGELDRKYTPPAPPKPRPFGGLTPSMSGKSTQPPVTGEQAARSAYEEVLSRHPGVLPALQEL